MSGLKNKSSEASLHQRAPVYLCSSELLPLIRLVAAFLVLMMICAVFAVSAPQSIWLYGSVVDEDGKPVESLDVKIQSPKSQTQLTQTDKAGVFEFSFETDGEYQLSLNKTGFFRLADQPVLLQAGRNEFAFTIYHETEIHEQIEVYSSSESIRPLETSHEDSLIAREIRDIPVKSTYDLRSSLQVLPEVVSDSAGQLHIAGGRAGESQYLLDGFDIGDPATGNLSVRINVDSVRLAQVESGRFGAQFGNGGASALSLNTAVGDDRWRAGATDFLPGISAQRRLHLTSWYPRFTLSGPLHKERAWFSEAFCLQRTVSLVEDLPRAADSIKQWAGDNMLRAQIKVTPKNILQANFLYNQRNSRNLGLNPLSPISTTRDLHSYRSFVSLKEQVWSGRSFYELGIAADIGHSEMLPHGSELYSITPNGSAGNHYESLRQHMQRWQGVGSVTMPTRLWHGTHDFQIGFNAASVAWIHDSARNDIQVIRSDNSIVQRTVFFGAPQFRLANTSIGIYAHDTWRVEKALVLQLGLREDWDRFLQRATPSPRISANILPFKQDRTKFSIAWGVYLQPVTLSSLGTAYDQQRSDVFYDRSGHPLPPGPLVIRFAMPRENLKQPRFYTTSVGWEQTLGKNSQIGINFTQRNGMFGLAYEKSDSDSPVNSFVLQNQRSDHYRSFQISFRHSFTDKSALSASYTRSSTRTNRVFDYSLDTQVFAPQESGPLAWDTPNRFVSSGWTPAPIWNLLLSYFFEYRTGFPFSAVNEQQHLVGPANRFRFPDYASLNVGVEKRIKLLTREWAVRFTILNLTGRENPDSVNNNADSPNFMNFGGGQSRAFGARVRLVG